MRTTIVPAQITTVEDKIAGNLGLSQIFLLISPIFGGSAIFVILPPFFSYASYKVALIAFVAFLSGICAVRIKGKIVLFWAIAILRYNIRPMHYVYDKNTTYTRNVVTTVTEEISEKAEPQAAQRKTVPKLTTAELVQLREVIANPATNLHFTTNKKGELRVHLNEVTHESLS